MVFEYDMGTCLHLHCCDVWCGFLVWKAWKKGQREIGSLEDRVEAAEEMVKGSSILSQRSGSPLQNVEQMHYGRQL